VTPSVGLRRGRGLRVGAFMACSFPCGHEGAIPRPVAARGMGNLGASPRAGRDRGGAGGEGRRHGIPKAVSTARATATCRRPVCSRGRGRAGLPPAACGEAALADALASPLPPGEGGAPVRGPLLGSRGRRKPYGRCLQTAPSGGRAYRAAPRDGRSDSAGAGAAPRPPWSSAGTGHGPSSGRGWGLLYARFGAGGQDWRTPNGEWRMGRRCKGLAQAVGRRRGG
jgi:hypothetical protein